MLVTGNYKNNVLYICCFLWSYKKLVITNNSITCEDISYYVDYKEITIDNKRKINHVSLYFLPFYIIIFNIDSDLKLKVLFLWNKKNLLDLKKKKKMFRSVAETNNYLYFKLTFSHCVIEIWPSFSVGVQPFQHGRPLVWDY